MAEIQKRLCPACGQANDYSNQTCSFCASPISEVQHFQEPSTSEETELSPEDLRERAAKSGLTIDELKDIAARHRFDVPFPAGNKKELSFLIAAAVITPLVILVLLALFGGLARLSDIWRVGG